MEKENPFKWKHYQPDIILLTVRWYLRYNLSFRDLVEMMEERGLSISHTTIMRWVHQYGPLNWTNEFVVTSSKPMTLGESMKHISKLKGNGCTCTVLLIRKKTQSIFI